MDSMSFPGGGKASVSGDGENSTVPDAVTNTRSLASWRMRS